jgi:hypothetical protein
MSHFAKIENGIVTQVIVAEQEFMTTFVDSTPGEWIKTSFNTKGGIHYGLDGQPDDGDALRKNFAGSGDIYNAAIDAFYTTQPHQSWILNEDTCLWEAPVPYPIDSNDYEWNEETLTWENM